MDTLSAREAAILDFERECAVLPGPKEPSIRQRFAVSPTTYYRALSALITRREAYDHDPLTVLRLRRLREERRRTRIEGRRAPASPPRSRGRTLTSFASHTVVLKNHERVRSRA